MNTILQAFHCKKRYRIDVTSPFLSAFLFLSVPRLCFSTQQLLDGVFGRRVALSSSQRQAPVYRFPCLPARKREQSFHLTGIHSLAGFVTVSKRGQSRKKRHRNTSPTLCNRHVTQTTATSQITTASCPPVLTAWNARSTQCNPVGRRSRMLVATTALRKFATLRHLSLTSKY